MNDELTILWIDFNVEHGGHGHSHGGITRSNNKLAQLANTDDNENNSFVFAAEVIWMIFFFVISA